jgi:hypothetical protein
MSSRRSAGGSASRRRSWCQRIIVRTLGGEGRLWAYAARTRSIVARGGPPSANSASAPRRRSRHVYDPGRGAAGGSANARPCAASARRRAAVRQPWASHSRSSVTAKSRPPRRHWNSGHACPSQSHTATPCVRRSSTVRPRVRSAQIAHTGRCADSPGASSGLAMSMCPVCRCTCRTWATRCHEIAPLATRSGIGAHRLGRSHGQDAGALRLGIWRL